MLEVRGSLTLDQVHQVLQTAFGWEDMHLHRFTADDPFAPLRPVDAGISETVEWLPRQECDEPDDRPEEDLSLGQLLALGGGAAFYEYDFGDGRAVSRPEALSVKTRSRIWPSIWRSPF